MDRGYAWLDNGTHDSLLEAAGIIATLQKRQGLMVACPEETAYRRGRINSSQLEALAQSDEFVVNLDKLTYAGNLENFASLQGDARHVFVQGDLGDRALVDRLFSEHRPRAVLHFAAESHVGRSIHGPEDFIQTNIVGTFRLLEAVRAYWSTLPEP